MSKAEEYCEGNLEQAYDINSGEDPTAMEGVYLVTPEELTDFSNSENKRISECLYVAEGESEVMMDSLKEERKEIKELREFVDMVSLSREHGRSHVSLCIDADNLLEHLNKEG